MTGNPSWSVLDLDDERLGDECVDIVERLGATWINARLEFYEDWITKLFKPDGKLLAEAPTRAALGQSRSRVIRRCERTNAHRYRGVRCRKAEPTRWEGGSDHAREHTRAHMEGRTHSNA